MSLQAIRDMRMQRQKPSAILSIIIGEAPKGWKSDANLIELRPGCQPALMDWRPVVGLWTAFYMLTPDWAVMDAAVDAATKAGAKLFGFVHAGKAHTLCDFDKPENEKRAAFLMRAEWEALCK